MRRSLVVSSIALFTLLVVGMGSGAIAQALSDAMEDKFEAAAHPEVGEPKRATDAASGPVAASTEPAKKMHTVPEDGDGLAAFDFVPDWLRALFASRPNEDLIVCLAGCSPHRDRVVYARLKDIAPEPAGAAAPQASAPDAQPGLAAQTTAPADGAIAAQTPVAAGASDQKDATDDATMPAFVPTFGRPTESNAGADPWTATVAPVPDAPQMAK